MDYQTIADASGQGDHPADTRSAPRGVIIVSTGGITGGGGIGSVTRMISRWIRDNRNEIHVSSIDPRGERSILWSPFYIVAGLTKIVALRLFGKADILHLHVSERISFPRKGLFMWVGRRMGMKVVLHHHGAELVPFYRSASPRMKALVHRMVRGADINIVLGEVWRRLLVDEMRIDPEKVVVFINAAENVGPGTEKTDPWQFLMVANLLPRKGVSELLQAVKRLKSEGAPVRLTLAGGGHVDRYKAEADQLGIADCTEFTGWISGREIHDLLRSHSALVLPSYHEGFPMAIIESLSAGLPVIATPVGSIGELMSDGQNCLLVTPGDVQALTDALRTIASDDALRHHLTDNGKALYARHFDIDGYMRRLVELYGRLQAS